VSALKEEMNTYRKGIHEEVESEDINDGKTSWDLSESDFQSGFRDFFNQPHIQSMRSLGISLSESVVRGMSVLIGDDLGDAFCQQYGFTSTALDATTDPSIALFFASHEAPFFTPVTDSVYHGVVYRWPREHAVIMQDLLLPLESSAFESVTASFRNFIKDSPGLQITQDALLRYNTSWGEFRKRFMAIVSTGECRAHGNLCFPPGTFYRSRIGRQRAVLLFPDFELVRSLVPTWDDDRCALIGDLLTTHHGEAFCFVHGHGETPKQLDKFTLWPSIRPNSSYLTEYRGLSLVQENVVFEDLYLEMLLRFFSSCSPCNMFVLELPKCQSRSYTSAKDSAEPPIEPIGVAHGIVDLGYLLHPADASLIANRLRNKEVYTPIPTLRYIPEEHVESFVADFAEAIAS